MILSTKIWGTEGGHPALVFLHGMGGTGSLYRPITALLEADFRCIAPDQRGHGESAAVSDGRYDIKAYAEDIWETLDSLGEDRVFLIGHSMGVRTALQAMALSPQRVRGLIGVDLSLTPSFGGGLGLPFLNFIRQLPNSFPSRPLLQDYLKLHCPDPSIAAYLRAAAKGPATGAGPVTFPFSSDALRQTIEQADQAPIDQWIREGLNHSVPILFLRGAQSLLWRDESYASQKQNFEKLPWVEFESWEGASHGLPFEKKAAFVARIRRFIEESTKLSGAD